MNVVAIGAHPDDVELMCGGTLLLCKERGDRIVSATTSNGERGFNHAPQTPLETVSSTRVAESTAVAEALGGEFVCLGQPDQFVEDTREARLAVADLLRRVRADLVLGPPPVDYHADHVASSSLVYNACMLAAVASVETEHEALARPPALYYMDAVAGLGDQPTHYVDVSPVVEGKRELLRMHDSQMENLRSIGGADLVELAEIMGRFRGLQADVAYAEGFRPALGWPRVRPGSPLP